MKVGVLPLARATFDVAFAEERFAGMRAALDRLDHEIVGGDALLFDGEAADAAIAGFGDIDVLLVCQVTFTDASTVAGAAERLGVPVKVWAIPEPRDGGRLRLNSFCGLNLASHALASRGLCVGALYMSPDAVGPHDLTALLEGGRDATPLVAIPTAANDAGRAVTERLAGKRIARLGAHPVGFDTCRYDAEALRDLADVEIEEQDIDALFDAARNVDDVSEARADAEADVSGLDEVDAGQLTASLKLRVALDGMKASGRFDAFAIRCWPETFTEYGGAVCGPVSQMSERGTPCACEADVYGALTQLILQDVADAPVFLVDLVDLDTNDDTGVVWHCGQAPVSMAAGERTATIHTNRKQPLLYEFGLKPGVVTFMRVSQVGEPRMVIGRAEMLDRPMAFTGTSGVLRFERPADAMLRFVVDSGLEHHVAIAYGDHVEALEGVAGAMGLPVLKA